MSIIEQTKSVEITFPKKGENIVKITFHEHEYCHFFRLALIFYYIFCSLSGILEGTARILHYNVVLKMALI